jgi:hypothetical protein
MKLTIKQDKGMTKKQFWQSASNWGMICGAALFVIGLISWGLKLEAGKMNWAVELMHFAVICPLILYTGFRNARLSGPQGYSYGRAAGYVFAMMMFAGIVWGVGQFLMVNFIARDYYDAIMSANLEAQLAQLAGSPQYDQMLPIFEKISRLSTNPIFLILNCTLTLVFKGGFLGLILAAFVKKNPDMFSHAADELPSDE